MRQLHHAAIVASLILTAYAASQVLPPMVVNLWAGILPDVSVLLASLPVAQGKNGRRNIYEFTARRPARWKSLGEISQGAVSAVLAAEDAGFWTHQGYEPESIRSAWTENLKAGRFVRGGSTITQQVVKNLFLSPDKTLSRKARELLLAVRLERALGKKKILEIYLNIAEWGPGIYGIEQAARKYFGKSASALEPKEGAMLAFMLPNPERLRHSVLGSNGPTAFGAGRVSDILYKLWRTGKISDEEYASGQVPAEIPSDL